MTTVTEPTRTEIADVLDKAIEVIEANGWHRGSQYNEDHHFEQGTPLANCPVCALGSINIAVCGNPLLGVAEMDIATAITLADAAAIAVARHLKAGTTPRDLARWNDELRRSNSDVIEAFRDTAAELRKGVAA